MDLGVVLARGGSKRVPGKNIKPLAGVPLIWWTLAMAQLSQSIDLAAVSSDSDEILQMVPPKGNFLPIKRPAIMAQDDSTPYDAIKHAITEVSLRTGHLVKRVCLLQPTSPFRTSTDIDSVHQVLVNADVPAVASCTPGEKVPNGSVYWARTQWLVNGGNWDDADVHLIPVDKQRSLDIDTPEDWEKAEAFAQEKMGELADYGIDANAMISGLMSDDNGGGSVH